MYREMRNGGRVREIKSVSGGIERGGGGGGGGAVKRNGCDDIG